LGDLNKEYSADFIFEEKAANGENSPQNKRCPKLHRKKLKKKRKMFIYCSTLNSTKFQVTKK
jgi:membrane-anchored glycerophosphoryl diester phosphodiesterase (GDPDase)